MTEIKDKFKLPQRLQAENEDFWAEYFQLFSKYNPVDIGQGFPDYPPPTYLTETFAQVARSDGLIHQYTRDYVVQELFARVLDTPIILTSSDHKPSLTEEFYHSLLLVILRHKSQPSHAVGHPRLVQILAKLYSPLIGHQIDPQNEILITVGAFEAIFSSIIGHVDIGDEVIIIEPFFSCYEPIVKMAGGVVRFIPLRLKKETPGEVPTSADWVLDTTELESLFNTKTKIIILNNPHNPLGKVFKREELEQIAVLCKKWNVVCISDEVYEWIVFKPHKHIRIATLPGMWERTITIGSIGKTFGVTGWRLGWAYAPSNLLHNLQMVHQNSVYTGNTPLQEVAAIALETETARLGQEDCFFNKISTELASKRDCMAKFLMDVGIKPTIPEGGYFMVADWSSLESQVDLTSEEGKYKDERFTKWMIKNIDVFALPFTPFYKENKKTVENFVRLCFTKKNENLEKASKRLKFQTQTK